ncbi:MAG: hypothetical protein KME11_21015 [Timaviella obliquedivisa GSE-PSE-MK23-08B]|nr:hypothetical protein [Timaviella obliquedivisa GSE-PSE-MK23-08B]
MASTPVVFVTSDRAIALPPEIQATLQPGDEYLVWQTDDTILLKKVQKPMAIADIRAKVKALGTDPEEPTLEELSQIVHDVHQQS